MGTREREGELERALRRALRGRAEVLAAYSFGSRAADRARSDSDVDVAVLVEPARLEELERALPFGYRAELATDLQRAVSGTAGSGPTVDLVLLDHAPPLLAHEVVRGGRLLLSRDEEARQSFEVRSLRRYVDTRPLRRVLASYQRRRSRRRSGEERSSA